MAFLGLLGLDGLLGGDVVVEALLDAQARHLLGQSLPVLRVAHGVDDRVQAGGDLGDEGGDLGHEGGDGALAANDGGEDDESIGSPDTGPEGDVGHGHLGDPDLGGFGGGASVGAK